MGTTVAPHEPGYQTIGVTAISPQIGAEVTGIDLRRSPARPRHRSGDEMIVSPPPVSAPQATSPGGGDLAA